MVFKSWTDQLVDWPLTLIRAGFLEVYFPPYIREAKLTGFILFYKLKYLLLPATVR